MFQVSTNKAGFTVGKKIAETKPNPGRRMEQVMVLAWGRIIAFNNLEQIVGAPVVFQDMFRLSP